MRKNDEISIPSSCLNKAKPNERLFVLLARDPAAPFAIRRWVVARCRLGKNDVNDPQVQEALECARLMEEEQKAS